MRDHASVLTYRLIGAAIEVHRALGPGLLESAYRRCLARELTAQGMTFASEVPIGIHYRDEWIDACYRLDLLVEGRVIVEVKSVASLTPLHDAQLLTYLRAGRYDVGLVLNFNVLSMRQGIRRLVL
ncbi:MAG TPA: GxxExxY protein [Gemmatimonadaceae bacterium]